MRKTPPLHLVEIPGTTHRDLAAAQNQALAATAHDLAATIRRLLAAGRLVNDHGKIIPARL
jgi:hypothetical protein